MNNDRREGVNLLNPEAGAVERESSLESKDSTPDFSVGVGESPRVDAQQLANVKSTISAVEVAPSAPEKEPSLAAIESILAENLGEIYSQLPEDKREAFKVKGEQIASTVNVMLKTAKVKVHKVLQLVSDWLGMIPGVNVYFLRQEAKIKLDKIMDYVEDQTKNSGNIV